MDAKKNSKLTGKRFVKLHFTDKTSVKFSFDKQGGDDHATLATNVKKALDADKLVVEADGSLFIIPMNNVKYVQVSPTPEALPAGVIRDATVADP